jgi:hypothetical protein
VAYLVILRKGGIPKIWGKTLLLLLLGIDIDLRITTFSSGILGCSPV